MDPITQQTTLASAGGKKDPVYVDDVFSTFLWQGTGSSQTINNGIDLAGKGGLVWSKNRGASASHLLNDSERGIESGSYYSELVTNSTAGNERFTPWGVTSFNNNGFTLGGSNAQFNLSNNNYVSWTFRKAPGWCDIVTYTGTGSVQNISHNLGSVPGMIIVKETSSSGESWGVYHRSLAASQTLLLNDTINAFSSTNSWNSTAPTSSVFTVGTETRVNDNGQTYIAYIFAHDDASFGTDRDESIIKCGSYTGNSGSQEINLGFEPQFILIKRSTGSSDWVIVDNMRCLSESQRVELYANTADDEYTHPDAEVVVTPTGFKLLTSNSYYNGSGTYIYMAIRRPHKPPEAGTEVFAVDTRSGTSPNPPTYYSGFPVDWVLERTTGYTNWSARTRLIGNGKELDFNQTSAEYTNTNTRITFDRSDGLGTDTSTSSTQYAWMFKRAAGSFDVTNYSGNGYGGGNTPNSINHNLSAPPEMIITRNRLNSGYLTLVYHSGLSSINSLLVVNGNNAEQTISGVWNSTVPTSTQFFLNLGENNYNNHNYLAYLFATLPGVSKVGSYSGTGNAINVDCGFTSGARFILIKRRDSSGDWYVYDTKRGIVSGNDPYLFFNHPQSQVTNTDYIDPLSSGFTVTSSAPAALNASGGTYIFLAIA